MKKTIPLKCVDLLMLYDQINQRKNLRVTQSRRIVDIPLYVLNKITAFGITIMIPLIPECT